MCFVSLVMEQQHLYMAVAKCGVKQMSFASRAVAQFKLAR